MSQRLNNFRTHSFPQRGVVLIMALIMLVIISLLATFSLRNAASTESVSGNVRTTQLASQAAEIALRYCEDGVIQHYAASPTFTISPILTFVDPPRWNQKDTSQNLTYWDGSSSVTNNAFILIPTSSVNGTTTFKRVPECMVENVQVVNDSGAISTTSTYVITARGFGPEVAAADPAVRSRPVGGEVWMQSTIELED